MAQTSRDALHEVVLRELTDGVLTVTINRPDRKNAANDVVWAGLRDAFQDAKDDPAVRAVILTGAGGAFCSGADLEQGAGAGHPLTQMNWVNQTAVALHELPKPIVAKVRGVAVGAGWNLALGCDLVVAAKDARFSQIFTKRGLSIDFGGSWLLPRMVGMQQAKRLTFLAEMVSAEEAAALNLVTYVVEPDELDGFTTDLGRRLAQAPPIAIAESKALLHGGVNSTLREALDHEARSQTIQFASADGPAALAAFLEKREPVFTGEWIAR
ncbi:MULTISPECIES: enoyl-CoA hydratase/isomerase family protein [unclassified Pseudofrankia]|uniref:enoyl-CoA hydratase/isomerase family protein n=1 Tax=unclassified Pseudofrankia TaxID=2994372 RepID=UPI0008DA78E8|nr:MULTISPECIES: enoyl-CoA hydratase [unclassified Pseudofrankia]MDT3446570.1 enoyl-CoA hydratase [Pseudofrankia sp. BMG5.37]OHV59924.1 enoyl-CoA hydratase [Pseudofrankia sp. BMG5.36]